MDATGLGSKNADENRQSALLRLNADLNEALANLRCIHGFNASACVELIDGNRVRPQITFRCYECKQTWSLPPRIDEVVAEVLARHADSL